MRYGTYPRHHPEDFENRERLIEEFVLPGFIPPEPVINESSKMRTQGSCFAENIYHAISNRGLDCQYLTMQEAVNSPIANRLFFDRVANQSAFPSHPLLDQLFPAPTIKQVQESIPNEDLFIFTVGVAGCWFDATSNAPTVDVDPKRLKDFSFRWLSAAENAQHLKAILEVLHHLNPDLHVVLTLSPVPLNRAFGYPSAVVGDCISKSTLRVAIAAVLETAGPKVSYWPSFEIVRWMGSHLPPVFGIDDGVGRHVSKEMVDTIVRLFLKHYAGL
jgi:hypothetical protein